MPLTFATNKEAERGTAYVGLATKPLGSKEAEISVIYKADRSILADVWAAVGAILHIARRGDNAVVIYNDQDYAEEGPDMPHGFVDENEG